VPLLVQLFKSVVKGNLVSVPSILVNDNQEAHMSVGTEIPTSTVTQGQFSDQTSFGGYEEAKLELRISPHISNDNYLRLEILLTVSAFAGTSSNPSIPPAKTTREFETNITMRSGKTVVIGGLTTDNQRETIAGIPFLSDLPIVGALFRNTGTDHEKTTLYVFITPTILSEFEALERISYERKLEVSKLNGQIKMFDPDFRPIDLSDEALSIEDIESTGYLDMPRYHPSQPLEDKDADTVPVKPSKPTPAKDDKASTESSKGK
jgi:type II secretory pathway component GspD/PulD (secretin)